MNKTLMSKKTIDIKAKKILISNIFYRAGSVAIKLFLNIYLFKISGNNVQIIALYNIIWLIIHLIFFTLTAKYTKNKNRNIALIISTVAFIITGAILVFIGEKVINYYLFIAMFFGVGTGCFGAQYYSNEIDFTNKHNRGHYFGIKNSFEILVGIIVPSISGIIIGINYNNLGYKIVFFITIFLFLLSGFFGFIRDGIYTKETFSLFKAWKKIKTNSDLMRFNIAESLLGFSLSVNLIDILVPTLLFYYGLKEIDLGFLVSTISIISIFVTYLFGKYVSYSKYKIAYFICILIFILSILILLYYPILFYIVILSSILNFLTRIIRVIKSVYSNNLFQDIKDHEKIKGEFIVIREIYYGIGLILSLVLLYYVGSFDITGIKIIFGCFIIVLILSGLIVNNIKFSDK